MSQDEITRAVRNENRVLLLLLLALVLATVLKPWLLVWDLGTPLSFLVVWGAMRFAAWVRSFGFTTESVE
jgi:hypothetical protein